jgi:hypothetical protein
MRALILATALAAALPGAATAQLQPPPVTTRAERQINDINRMFALQARQRAIAQQNQFEINQLRNEIQRERSLSIPGRSCVVGVVSC